MSCKNTCLMVSWTTLLAACLCSIAGARPTQTPLYERLGGVTSSEQGGSSLPAIRRVAVIGAGPNGLLSAAALIEQGFDVRLFERAPAPGGNWFCTPEKPIHAGFPDAPLMNAAYTPDVPEALPRRHIYHDGDNGLTNDERWREHWNPSPVWHNLRSNSAPSITSLPNINYPPDVEWALTNQEIKRHVRQYSSYVGLNSNDEGNAHITSYGTRVEALKKSPGGKGWTLTLRKLEQLAHANEIRADWWTEEFDAVVVSTGDFDAPHTPSIEGIDAWGKMFPEQIYHSRRYREPTTLAGKNVLIVGASVSAAEIARDISPYVSSLSISMRYQDPPSPTRIHSLARMPPNITFLPEITSFSSLETGAHGIADVRVTFLGGKVVQGFDEIILATGYRRSNPFLADYHNSTIVGTQEPEVQVAPIITDGTHLRSLHWTGHYIPDPTLAFMNVRAWTLGRFQALGIAKSWSGKAHLPSEEEMWAEYPGAKRSMFAAGFGAIGEEALNRLFVVWLNNASLEFGGRLVSPWSIENREAFVYFADKSWGAGYTSRAKFVEYEETPRSDWAISATTLEDEGVLYREDW